MAEQRLTKLDKQILETIVSFPDLDNEGICSKLDIPISKLLKSVRKELVQEELKQMQKDLLALSSYRRTKQAIDGAGKSSSTAKSLFEMDGSLKKQALVNIDNRKVHNDVTLVDIRKRYDEGKQISIPDLNNVGERPRSLTAGTQKAIKHVQFIDVEAEVIQSVDNEQDQTDAPQHVVNPYEIENDDERGDTLPPTQHTEIPSLSVGTGVRF